MNFGVCVCVCVCVCVYTIEGILCELWGECVQYAVVYYNNMSHQ